MTNLDQKNILVWLKAMSRANPLPLDETSVWEDLASAQAYAKKANAYGGQIITALDEATNTYKTYVLNPGEDGYTLKEFGADVKITEFVQVVSELPSEGMIEGVLYINTTDGTGSIYTTNGYKQVFRDVETDLETINGAIDSINDALDTKAPIENPVFKGSVTLAVDPTEDLQAATKQYVDRLINGLVSSVPGIVDSSNPLPSDGYRAGQTWRVAESGMYAGQDCEAGDLVIAIGDGAIAPEGGSLYHTNLDLSDNQTDIATSSLTDYTTGLAIGDVIIDANNDKFTVAEVGTDVFVVGVSSGNVHNDFMVVQANINGAVTSKIDSSTDGDIVVFDGITGRIIKSSSVSINSLQDAIDKAHTHTNKDVLDTYDKTQDELLTAAKSEAQGLVDNLSQVVEGKADKATTLAGYGITDAYTKAEIDTTVQDINTNLNSKISTSDAEAKINKAKEEVTTGYETYVGEKIGEIPDGTSVKEYVDNAINTGSGDISGVIAQAKADAIAQSKAYTDQQLGVVEF